MHKLFLNSSMLSAFFVLFVVVVVVFCIALRLTILPELNELFLREEILISEGSHRENLVHLLAKNVHDDGSVRWQKLFLEGLPLEGGARVPSKLTDECAIPETLDLWN